MKIQSRLLPWPKVMKATLVMDIILKEFCDYVQRKGKFIYLILLEPGNVKTS